MNLKDKVTELKESGLSWKQVAEELEQYYPNLTMEQRYDKARNAYRGISGMNEVVPGTINEENETTNKEIISNKTVEYKASDGTTTFNGIIALMDGEPITPEVIMRGHNLDAKEWEVVSHKSNFYQQQKKGGTTLTLYQSKITVRPKKKDELTLEDIDKYFENKDYSSIVIPTKPIIVKNGETLEVDIADVHTGLLAHEAETGNNYDLKIAKKNFFNCIYDIEERCKNKNIKKIELVNLGDFLHCDDFNASQTTAGTRQDSDGRIGKILDYGETMLIGAIEILGNIAPIEFLQVVGNHDSLTGYALCRSVANAFRKDKNVSFDINPNPIKKRMFGKNLVLFHHGNAPKNNIDDLVYKYAREEFGRSNYSEIHMGHLHSEIVRPKCGTIIRNVTAITGASYWENQQCYHSPMKAITSFVWSDERGLRDIWYSSI